MRNLLLTSVVFMTSLMCIVQPAGAVARFQMEFLKLYVNEHPDPEFTEYVRLDVKCWICHQGKSRKNRNAYGNQLSKLLDKTKDIRNTEKIIDALKKVADMPYNPDNENSETFGERIAAGKLPGADSLDELKAEPKESE